MSRSYKKHPILKDRNEGMKQIANKRVRHSKELNNGCMYKKLFNSYDICDYVIRTELVDYMNYSLEWGDTFEQGYHDWITSYYYK